jgi:fibronectin type 3 domain-containing protein
MATAIFCHSLRVRQHWRNLDALKGTGTITQSGLYTAPQAVETDVVTATSQADSTKSASATITVAAPHTVALTWNPSISTGVTYAVYRGTVTGGPYLLLLSGMTGNSYTDKNVQSGSTYYYVTTAAASGGQSSYSNEVQVVIPMP